MARQFADSATFPGLKISHADFILTHGVTPSVCVVTCVPGVTNLQPGPLSFYAKRMPAVTFQDCTADDSSTALITERRGQRTIVRILDRRWRWRGKKISGRWNTRAGDGTCLTDTKKTYKQLIETLFSALGETKYSIEIEYPEMEAPTVDWVNASADLELAWLVDRIGALVVLGTDNIIRVVQAGSGAVPAQTGKERTAIIASPQKTCPAKISVRFAPTIYQALLPLEAVGMDLDGKIRPIDQLSYTPKADIPGDANQPGWSTNAIGLWSSAYLSPPKSPGDMGTFGHKPAWLLASQTVYKWYRIKENLNISLPDGTQVSKRSDILPLRESLIAMNSTLFNVQNIALADPPHAGVVVGTYAIKSGTYNVTGNVDSLFVFDHERGVVQFPGYVYKLTGTTSVTGHAQADLNLLCSFYVRQPDGTLKSYVETVETKAPGGVGELVLTERDMFNWHAYFYYDGTTSVRSTRSGTELTSLHGKRLGATYAKQFTVGTRSDVQLVGVANISPNGRIRQVRWTIRPGLGSETVYSLDGEPATAAPQAKERRSAESLENLIGGGYV